MARQGKTAFWTKPLLTKGPGGKENWRGQPLFPPEVVSKTLKEVFDKGSGLVPLQRRRRHRHDDRRRPRGRRPGRSGPPHGDHPLAVHALRGYRGAAGWSARRADGW
jgi:hypothetical protein